MDVAVRDVAEALGVSSGRVRQMIEAGRLPARKVAGRWVVPEAAIPRSARLSRPMSERMAWALIGVISGEEVDVAQGERYRLSHQLERLRSEGRPAMLLRSWLPRRARLLRLACVPGDVAELLADERLVPSGVSDPRSGMSASGLAEGYLRPGDLKGLRSDYLMAEDVNGNVVLHVSDRPLPRPVPLGAVIVDLADRDGPREDRRVEVMLDECAR